MKKRTDPMDEIFVKIALDLNHENSGKAIACLLMKNVMYDNGMVNRWEPEKYPLAVVQRIAAPAKAFFAVHPDLLTVEHLDQIATGFEEDIAERYGKLPGFVELHNALNDWFNGDER